MTAKIELISKVCCNKGCTRVAAYARKMRDFWITTCEPCSKTQITLDFSKIADAAEQSKKARGAA